MQELEKLLTDLEPDAALEKLLPLARQLLTHLDDEARRAWFSRLLKGADQDKLAGMVNLWLARCLDEGVDPTNMCQNLVHKVTASKQLQAVAEPEILNLFESWLDELEEEAAAYLKKNPAADRYELAAALGLSASGAAFLLAKQQQRP